MKKITLLLAFLIGAYAQAQWNTDTAINTLVADSESSDMQAISTSDGKTYVVFWKPVPAPENFELRVQLLDELGIQQFGSEGALISDTIPMSSFTSLWSISIDSNDNLYVGVTGTSGNVGFAYKIDITGTVLWTVSNPSSFSVKVLPMSSGDAIVAWLSETTFSATMQKYDVNGNAVWPSVQTAAAPSSPADLYEISSGDYVLVYHQLGSGINSTLFAQRFDTDGNAVWSSPTQLSNKTTAFNINYDGTQDGDVVYYSYSGKTGTRFDSFVQRINADGSLPWGINGSDFDTNETDYEMQTKIAFSAGSNYVWAICTYRNPSQSEVGEYVQKFDKITGARQFTENAKQVFAIGSDMAHAGKLQLANDQPLFLLINGENNGASPVTLDATYLDGNGDFVWATQTKPMATFSAPKGRVQFLKPLNGQVITVFVENKGAGDNMYAQNLIDSFLSIDELDFGISLQYINPVKDILNLSSDIGIQTIMVSNSLGQLILKESINSNQVLLSSQSWKSGIYFVKLTFNNGLSKVLKILKE